MLRPAHAAPVSDVCIAPDRAVWTASYDGSVGRWVVDEGRLCADAFWPLSPKNLNCIAVSTAGDVAAGCSAGRVSVLHDGAVDFLAHRGDVESVAWSASGRLASGGTDGFARVFDTNQRLVAELRHGATVGAMCFVDEQLVTVCNDGMLRRFDEDLRLMEETRVSSLPLKSVAPMRNGVVLGGHDRRLRAAFEGRVETLNVFATTPKALASDGDTVALASYDNCLLVGTNARDLEVVSRDPRIWAHGVAVRDETIAVGSFDGVPLVFQRVGASWAPVMRPAGEVACISSLALGRHMLTAGDSGVVRLDGHEIARLGEPVTAIRWSATGIVAATWSGALHVDVGGPRMRRHPVASAPLVCCEIDGTDALVGLYTGGVACVDLVSGKVHWQSLDATGAVKAIDVHGRRAVVVGRYDPLRLLDRVTGETVCAVPLETSVSDAVRFNPSGRRIAAAAGANELRVYDAATLTPLNTFLGHARPIKALAWLDEDRVVSGDYAGIVLVHDRARGTRHLAVLPSRLGVSALAVNARGQVVASTFDGDVFVVEASR